MAHPNCSVDVRGNQPPLDPLQAVAHGSGRDVEFRGEVLMRRLARHLVVALLNGKFE